MPKFVDTHYVISSKERVERERRHSNGVRYNKEKVQNKCDSADTNKPTFISIVSPQTKIWTKGKKDPRSFISNWSKHEVRHGLVFVRRVTQSMNHPSYEFPELEKRIKS